MEKIKDFFIDFYREIVVLAIVLLAIFMFLGYRSRGGEINDLKSQVETLKTQASTDSSTASTTNNQADESTENNEATEDKQQNPYEGFKLADGSSWKFSSGDASNGYTFNKGSQKIDVIIKPKNLIVGADVNWKFTVEDNNKLKLTDSNETFCIAGQSNCTFGDGRLQVLANQTISEGKTAEIQFFMTDEEYVEGGTSFSEFKKFINSVTVE